ncbi:TPR repeat protein [Entamoeba nuttalli P19]|uniref:TPR repeat protein n=2 Tax=Entamoeba nuttalli TaxID=412467 RepID=K2HNC3_ENTNP|nr:TPR repeat protein [Entamoeba nuttalli P19]EKE37365.1 TPR repeat protein [Entamoeba nuttalli P19]|eukprot:XP_008860295.1 TPR repeat protein [Entamoeba nuttalli P19]
MSNKQLSEAAKARGTQAFKDQKFEEAIKEYTEAIKYDETNGVLYSNRSACYASLEQFEKALEDANKTIEYKPDWSRGYSRKAFALLKLERYEEAEEVCNAGLKIDPENQMLKDILDEVYEKKVPFNVNEMWKNWRVKLAANPKTASYLNDPVFVSKIEKIAADPKTLQTEMNDVRITEAMIVLMGIDMNNFKPQEQEHTNTPMEEEKPKDTPKPEEKKMEEETPKKEETQPMEEVSPEDIKKKEAQQQKEKGNELYKQKKFNEAMECYDKAIELDPSDLTFKLNKSAVFLEMEKYDECIKLCNELLDEYKEQRIYTQNAKLFMRIGNAYFKQDKYTEALDFYKKSCTEKRTEEILNKIKITEKKKEAKEQQEYFSVEKGEEARAKGSAFFKEQNFPEAIKCYTEAIKRNPNDHLAYSNRAAAYQKLGEHPYAIKDAEMCIKIKPDFIKGYNRKAFSHFCMKEYNKALTEYEHALKIDPNNAEATSGITTVQNAIMGASNAETDEERLRHAMADPEIQSILTDPMMRNILDDMGKNPASATKYLQDPEVRSRIEKLIAAGIIKTA